MGREPIFALLGVEISGREVWLAVRDLAPPKLALGVSQWE